MLTFSQDSDVIREQLAAICHALTPITKSSENPHYSSRYADYAALMHVVQPLLIQHECYITQYYMAAAWMGTHLILEPMMVTRLSHPVSGEWVETFVPYAVQDATNPQKHGSAQTYAKRYGLTNLLNIVTDTDDDDGNNASSGGPSNREFRGTGSGTDEHGVRKLTSKYDNKCAMCGGPIKVGDEVAWKKEKPAAHWSCYQSWKSEQPTTNGE